MVGFLLPSNLTMEADMSKMASVFALLFICLLGHTGAIQESVELLRLSSSNPSPNDLPLAVSLPSQYLKGVSSSVLVAEMWLKTHVLSHYPASGITHIVIGHNVLCSDSHEDQFGFVLPSIKNLYYSLTRWGLERDIKLSPSISSQCLEPDSSSYKEDMAENIMKPLLEFIQSTNSTYLVNPSRPVSKASDELHGLVSSHLICMRKLGSFETNHIKVIFHEQKPTKPTSRKLSSFDAKVVDPYPARPTPLPELSPSSSVHLSFAANIAKSPLPPLIGSTSPPFYFPPLIGSNSPPPSSSSFAPKKSPPFYFPPLIGSNSPPPSSSSFAPKESPVVFPTPPPFGGFHLPPCNPSPVGGGGSAPAPEPGVVVGGEKLWCVAKPSVPSDTLQEAIDFACGEGADCAEIQSDGNCYNPDTVVAHASYAFNSYWQKTKRHGGTCSFGGTAMIINADPSFLNCRFIVS